MQLDRQQTAEIIGTDKCSIANWEHNRSGPRARYLPKIIDFLGYTPKDLFTFNTLGEKIRVYRQIHGLTKKELADKIGIDEGTIRYLENGKHKPTKRMIEKITTCFEGNPKNSEI
ncbi:MAG: antitoxin HipB [Planctomycetes bacterium ADurb.Bin401]|nr:MAG: antitoxin HipB [Planctomycetes bacterium ADurb.Bin401]